MIHVHCDFCGDELEELGGILLSPPLDDGTVAKDHLCVDCYEDLIGLNDDEEEIECKPWCNSQVPEGKTDEKGVKYCNCHSLDNIPES